MKEEQRLFLVQATSSHAIYKLLKADKALHHCHALHYLQMSTELLGKANAWRRGPIERSHKAFVNFLRSLSSNRKAQKQLGFEGQNENWVYMIKKLIPIAESLQNMAPALANDGPNPEYPWPTDSPTIAPVEYNFHIWEELTETSAGRTLLSLIDHLFETAEDYM